MPAPSRAFSLPISTGDQISPAACNRLDDGQFWAVTRNGTTALLSTSGVQGAGFTFTFDCSDNPTSKLVFKTDTADAEFLSTGAGRFVLPGNRTHFTDATEYPTVETHTATDVVPGCTPIYDKSTTPGFAEGLQRIQQVAATQTLNYWLNLLPGTVIKSVTVYLKKAAGTAGLPGSLPGIGLYYYNIDSESSTQVGSSVADTSANIAAYRTHHALTVGSLSHTVEAARNYILSITGDDDSTSAGTGLYIYRPKVTVEVSSLRPF